MFKMHVRVREPSSPPADGHAAVDLSADVYDSLQLDAEDNVVSIKASHDASEALFARARRLPVRPGQCNSRA